MKKIVSLLVAVMLMVSAAGSLAETMKVEESAPKFDVEVTLPDGAKTKLERGDDWTWLRITLDEQNGAKPVLDLTIAPDEEFEGKDMKDLTEEDKQNLIALLSENAAHPTYVMMDLADGNQLLVVEEDTEENDFAAMETIYDGYFICLYGRYEDYDKLTADDLAAMYEIMQSLVITKVDEPK